MAVRLIPLVAAAVAALAIMQANSRKPPRPKPSEKKGVKPSKHDPEEEEERLEEQFADLFSFEQDEEEEEEEEHEDKVKTVSSSAQSNLHLHGLAGDEELLSEFEDLLSREVELPFPQHGRSQHESNTPELERLRRLVNELDEREATHKAELLEYYGLKEQEADVAELRKQLEITAAEVETLNATVSSLQAERKRLDEEAAQGAAKAKAELEAARSVVAELERQVAGLRAAEKEAAKELEAEVVELRRRNRELENEKGEMAMKLYAAESRAVALSINWP